MYQLRRLSALALSLAITSLLFSPLPAAAAQEDNMPLPLSSASALLMEKETGTILLQQNAHQKLEPASVTKVMTLLLVMEAVDSGRLSLDESVPVSAHAAGMGGSQVYLKEGERLSVSDLIKCVAVVSGNDCAVALAERLSGSESAFVDQMNQKAQALGMEDTHFVNCTGLPAPGHLTSAYDIALMSRQLLLHHPDIRQYTTIWTDSIRNGAFGLTNTNRLIRFYDGATGLKTGFTASAQYCMSAAAQRNGMELIAVVMKAPTTAQRFQDASCLLDYGFANYALLTPQPEGPLAPIDVLLGQSKTVQPQLQRECRLLVEKAQADQITTRVDLARDVQAPVDPGQTLGEFQVYVGEQLRDTVPIVAAQGVERLSVPGLFSQLLRRLLFAG
ncbi:D-alanyl-D-alanine carboxypeptidase family protein [Flintibacter faecis]|uniref:serine-type D-Ala-D-Ala carboxypeptidase n=1 Tax=Flintibacter faecis TaxID=2763047 RepID=A0A8J6M349_9FIRM|nr:D-alanyl-D-alanine carboxypeptidase family protein [Flintibacter faecis]MBC5716193.1 D-alanyl-D-alanine carboxypeptidase [Flintibacter faecis]